MAKKQPAKRIGPPIKTVNWELFEQLCGIQCTQSEICSMLKIHDDTLRKKCIEHYGESYSDVYKKISEGGKCSLRRYQWAHARTNVSMAIWLGKVYLGQREPTDEKVLEFNGKLGELLDALATQKRAAAKEAEPAKTWQAAG